MAVIVGANEVYSNSRTPLDYAAQKAQTARMFADSGPEFILSLAREPGNSPRFAPVAETYNKIVQPTIPVLVMDATLDSNTFYGNGLFTKDAMGENATLVTVRGRNIAAVCLWCPYPLLSARTGALGLAWHA